MGEVVVFSISSSHQLVIDEGQRLKAMKTALSVSVCPKIEMQFCAKPIHLLVLLCLALRYNMPLQTTGPGHTSKETRTGRGGEVQRGVQGEMSTSVHIKTVSRRCVDLYLTNKPHNL